MESKAEQEAGLADFGAGVGSTSRSQNATPICGRRLGAAG